ncbi:MAG: MFS transporter [Planctomycetota bacterium]
MRQVAEARLGLHPGEGRLALLGALFFYALLAAYYLLRPLRDSYGAADPDELPRLFLGTFAATVAVQPLFGALVSRFGRARIAPVTFRALGVVTLVLGACLVRFDGAGQRAAQVAFFCWLSVFNLTGVSLFWGLCADHFGRARSLRLFGPIAVGGTLGAMTGSTVVGFASVLLPALEGAPFVYAVLSAALLEVCVRLARALARRSDALEDPGTRVDPIRRSAPIGGGVLAGFQHVRRSRYLTGIALYVVVYVTGSTLLYDEGARIMRDAFATDGVRSIFFARIDLLTNAMTLLLQLFATSAVLQRVGVGPALAAVPVVTTVGFAALLADPSLFALALFSVLRRCAEFGLSKPAREALFTVTSDEDKYKAKLVVDTVAYRGGDAAALWAKTGLLAVGVGAAALSIGVVAFSALGVVLAALLGRGFARRSDLA